MPAADDLPVDPCRRAAVAVAVERAARCRPRRDGSPAASTPWSTDRDRATTPRTAARAAAARRRRAGRNRGPRPTPPRPHRHRPAPAPWRPPSSPPTRRGRSGCRAERGQPPPGKLSAAARLSIASNPSGNHSGVAAHRYCPLIHVPVGRARMDPALRRPSRSSTLECAAWVVANLPVPTGTVTATCGSRSPIALAGSGSRLGEQGDDLVGGRGQPFLRLGDATPCQHREGVAPLDLGNTDGRGVVRDARGLVAEDPTACGASRGGAPGCGLRRAPLRAG